MLPLRAELVAAFEDVLDSGRFVLGPQLEAFEREFASFVNVKHAVGVSSGTDALRLILEALDVRGGEVIVPAVSFIATAEAVVAAGAVPVFADIDADTWVLTAETVEPHITDRTVAILPVHLFGNPANIEELRRLHPLVIEDAAQALGSSFRGKPCGSLGRAAAFSFYPSKVLGGIGDGGAITTNDDELARRARLLRSHGSEDNQHHELVGGTSRLDEIQAACLRVLLSRARAHIVRHHERGSGDQKITQGGWSNCHQTVRLGDGEGRHLYPVPCHRQQSMQPYFRGPLPNAERFCEAHHAQPPISHPAGAQTTERNRVGDGAGSAGSQAADRVVGHQLGTLGVLLGE
jgi:hypothetical protein